MKANQLTSIVGCLICTLTLLSCVSEPTQETSTQAEKASEITLYPRRTDAPVVLTIPLKEESSLRSLEESVSLHSFLARTYDPTAGIVNSWECYKAPLFDIDGLIKYRSTAVDFLPIKSFDVQYAAFSSKESYEEHLKRKYTRGGGFSIGIPKLFSVGFSHSMSKAFETDYLESNHIVYGAASFSYDYGRYWRSSDGFTKRKIKWNYLSRTFLDNLYSTPLSATFHNAYGVLIPTSILTGAKAEALFRGVTIRQERHEAIEDGMSRTIQAGITFPKGEREGSFSAKDSIGFSWGSDKKWKGQFSSIQITTRTVGGGAAKPFSPAKSIDGFSIDFAPWLATLRGPQDYTVTDLRQFESIEDYVMEENFKQHIQQRRFDSSLGEPKIIITNNLQYNMLMGHTPQNLYLVLRTRHGDNILLRPIHPEDEKWWTAEDEAAFDMKAEQLASIMKERYNLAIVKDYHSGSIERMQSESATALYPGEVRPIIQRYFRDIEIPLYGMDEMKMTRCYHKGYDMEFLLYDGGRGHRYAFAIYDKAFIGTYGLEKIYQKARQVSFPEEYIMDEYTVIGL